MQVLVALYENYILSSGQLYTWLLSCIHIECPGDLRGLFAQHCMIIREVTFKRYWWWYYCLISRAEWFQPFVHAPNLNACQSCSSQLVSLVGFQPEPFSPQLLLAWHCQLAPLLGRSLHKVKYLSGANMLKLVRWLWTVQKNLFFVFLRTT